MSETLDRGEPLALPHGERAGRLLTGALRRLGRGTRASLTLLLVLAGWEVYARSGAVSNFLLPPLSVVLERVWQDTVSGDLLLNLGATLYRGLFGFAIAAVAGVIIGILIARSAAVRWFFDPIVSIGFPMPKIAFLPIFMLWFGLYDTSKVTMIAVSAIFPVVTATVVATQGVESWCGRRVAWAPVSASCCGRLSCRRRCRRF
jgi:ABC-type nitrate/sulfonate/bicarbonate transport system permease component